MAAWRDLAAVRIQHFGTCIQECCTGKKVSCNVERNSSKNFRNEALAKIYQSLKGPELEQFLERFEYLHDAEITEVSINEDRTTLTITLETLCVFEEWWRETDTAAALELTDLSNLKISGELVEYGVAVFEVVENRQFRIVSNVGGVIEGNYGAMTITACFISEPKQKV